MGCDSCLRLCVAQIGPTIVLTKLPRPFVTEVLEQRMPRAQAQGVPNDAGLQIGAPAEKET
jgi:hypothetical protein